MAALLDVKNLGISFGGLRAVNGFDISIEKEQYSPSLMLAYRLALVFGVAVEDLCCLEENLKLEDQKYEDLS